MNDLAKIDIRAARLPGTYEQARVALSECVRVDECKTWAIKAEALASYAKQSKDETLRKMADRIQARAIRRCGELLAEIEAPRIGKTEKGSKGGRSPSNLSRQQVARDAGLSDAQRKTALRVASMSEEEFEEAVESDDPPTVTELARHGTKKGPPAKEGFVEASRFMGVLRSMTEMCDQYEPRLILLGLNEWDMRDVLQQSEAIIDWLTELKAKLKQRMKK